MITSIAHANGVEEAGFHHMWGWGSGFGGIGMAFFWIVVLLLVVFIVKWTIDQGRGTSNKDAIDILKERYAKGEIDKDEFEDKKKDLQV